MKMFYNSSLPRSGSSLLQNLLGQNPDFYVTPTSGLLELVFAARSNYTNSPEFKAQDSELMETAFLDFCRTGMEGYFLNQTDSQYIVDKSRGWGVHFGFLDRIFNEKPKILIMIRDLRDVLTSMEKIYRKNPQMSNDVVNHGSMQGTTVRKRCDIWLNTQPIGLAIERIAEIIQQGIYQHVKFIKYEDLLEKPEETMNGIYDYLEVDRFKHNFNHIEQLTIEDDSVYGMYGNHTIQTKLGTLNSQYKDVLGNSVSEYIREKYSWFFDYFRYV